ncbi:cbb3-type cytochrome c oxidase subunit I [Deltaproteobacteria bacterium]|nr:cbb3-type cytochrome c oxidase subunit I [Deltaproteobacteria bacterium]
MSAIIFFSLAILYIAMIALSHKAVNGMGEMRKTMRHFTVFMLDKAPAGIIDFFSKKENSGSRTWIIQGALWATVAATIGFLNIWLKYDAQALDSLSSIGWKYNADVMSGFSETSLIFGFLFMTFIGAALHILPRANGGKLASEANASLMAFAWSGVLFFSLIILPLLLKFTSLGDLTDLQLLFFPAAIQVAMAMILGALLVNLLLALGERTPSTSLSASTWFILLGFTSVIWAFIIRGSFLALFGNAIQSSLLGDISLYQQLISGDASSVVWMADRIVTGWFPLAMMLAIAYHVIPSISGSPIWSRSLSVVSFTTLFISVPVLMMSDAALADDTLLSVAAVLVVLGLVPLLASSSNLIATMQGRWEKVLASPGGAASASAVLLLPIIALMGFFSSLDEINGAHNMGGVQATVDHGLLWLVGGLMALAVWGKIFPEVVGRRLSSRSKARWSFWLFLTGGLGSTISMLMADFVSISMTDAGVEDISSHLGGYYLTSAALFYALVMGTFVAAVNLISTLFSDEVVVDTAPVSSGMDSFELQPGSTSIRDLVSKGVGVDTLIIISAASEEDEEEDSTEVGVSAALHTDEGVVMPKAEPVKAAPVDALAAFQPELVDLARWLKSSGTTTIDLFMKMDLDSDGTLSPFEIREGLASLDIVDLPPWDVEKLVTSIDLDGDGKINIPELDIHIMRIMNSLAAEDDDKGSTDEAEEDDKDSTDEAEEDDSLDEASLSSLKKAELVALAEERGISSKGKKSDIIARLCE